MQVQVVKFIKECLSSRPNQARLVFLLIILVTLACATNTPVAQVATPRPTRTLFPTFTNTPIPPSATPVPTATPIPPPTDTPIPTATSTPTATPLPSDTPQPSTTPVPPTNTPAPPPPPTNTPLPTNTPAPVFESPLSPLATPTPVPPAAPDTPPGRYEVLTTETERNCAHIGVIGQVTEKGSNVPVANVQIQVTGEGNYTGPFTGRTDADGNYTILIGPTGDVREVEFTAEVVGPANVVSEDKPEWETSADCNSGGEIQIMKINWGQKR